MLKKQNHTHTLRRHVYKSTGNSVFFCTGDDCSYKIECSLSLGKKVICNRCGDEFKMDVNNIRQAKPHCVGCNKKRIKDPLAIVEKKVNTSEVTSMVATDVASNLSDKLKNAIQSVKQIEGDI